MTIKSSVVQTPVDPLSHWGFLEYKLVRFESAAFQFGCRCYTVHLIMTESNTLVHLLRENKELGFTDGHEFINNKA